MMYCFICLFHQIEFDYARVMAMKNRCCVLLPRIHEMLVKLVEFGAQEKLHHAHQHDCLLWLSSTLVV